MDLNHMLMRIWNLLSSAYRVQTRHILCDIIFLIANEIDLRFRHFKNRCYPQQLIPNFSIVYLMLIVKGQEIMKSVNSNLLTHIKKNSSSMWVVLTLLVPSFHESSIWELELAIFGGLMFGVDKFLTKAQTIKSLTNLQALVVWASGMWPYSKWDIEEAIVLNKPKNAWKPIGLGPQKRAWSFNNYQATSWRWLRNLIKILSKIFMVVIVVVIPQRIHQGVIKGLSGCNQSQAFKFRGHL